MSVGSVPWMVWFVIRFFTGRNSSMYQMKMASSLRSRPLSTLPRMSRRLRPTYSLVSRDLHQVVDIQVLVGYEPGLIFVIPALHPHQGRLFPRHGEENP